MTQKEQILDYLNEYGSISSYEAYIDLGITQLAARIFELENVGYSFDRISTRKRNRLGKQVTFYKYKLREGLINE